jgi:hypothetical protein
MQTKKQLLYFYVYLLTPSRPVSVITAYRRTVVEEDAGMLGLTEKNAS